MFDIGFSEIVVIFGLALVVLGPDKLPRLAQTIGRWVGRARAMARQFRDQLEQEAHQFKTDIDPNAPLGTRATPPPASASSDPPQPASSQPESPAPASPQPESPAPASSPPASPPLPASLAERPTPPGEGSHREPPGGGTA
ncbi:MAG: twin-arginine translocase subunit TatB [Gammaproteobacteria bacterium]|nr:twin-arginine translocase subunit TatB [Gammaproteobacteria bacterium]